MNVDHVDRVSNEMALLADELSRRPVSRSESARKALEAVKQEEVSGYLLEWLKNPKKGESLCRALLKELDRS